MPKRRRPGRIPTPAWERPRGALGRRLLGRGLQFYGGALAGLIVAVAVGLIAFALWSDYNADRQRPGSTAVQVGDVKFTLEYFSRRLKMYVDENGGLASNSQAILPGAAIPFIAQQLTDDGVVLALGPSEFGVSASEDEIKAELAARLNIQPTDPNFDSVFQRELARTGLSEEQYRQLAEVAVLTNKVRTALQERVSSSAESVHYRQIRVAAQTDADQIKTEVEGGADFAALAQERSTDEATKGAGGDAGWVPRGFLSQATEDVIFALEPNGLVVAPAADGVYVYQLLEKAADREIDPGQRDALIQRSFDNWLEDKQKDLEVKQPVVSDQEKLNWVIAHAYQV